MEDYSDMNSVLGGIKKFNPLIEFLNNLEIHRGIKPNIKNKRREKDGKNNN